MSEIEADAWLDVYLDIVSPKRPKTYKVLRKKK